MRDFNGLVMLYYIGHGVENNNHTHAVLKDGEKRKKYDLEKMVRKIGKNQLVSATYDCNRHYLNNIVPQTVKKYPKKADYCDTYTAFAGASVKAIDSVYTYVDHMKK